ncbi:hypothetical protein AS156_18030 [Bradyrhizobium macuxiense]|uniref:Uncharacterized protein n=1 Tax=Bradyrhizobium macuxiense TaxID=1755647 RepID=A0A125Q6M7_9BRAD|nr:hypothetical protein [Bradyrhizobium macuxiense]KWV48382.1 hypothetical protein AS156_18030 [Bradyrhizobium macuxiense]
MIDEKDAMAGALSVKIGERRAAWPALNALNRIDVFQGTDPHNTESSPQRMERFWVRIRGAVKQARDNIATARLRTQALPCRCIVT